MSKAIFSLDFSNLEGPYFEHALLDNLNITNSSCSHSQWREQLIEDLGN